MVHPQRSPSVDIPYGNNTSNTFASAEGVQIYGNLSQRQAFSNDRIFKCDQCPQSFNRYQAWKHHKLIHLAINPFPCGNCNKSFRRKDALKRHILVKGCGKNTDVHETDIRAGRLSPSGKHSHVQADFSHEGEEDDDGDDNDQETSKKRSDVTPLLDNIRDKFERTLGIIGPSDGCTTILYVKWDPIDFMDRQFGDTLPKPFGSVIVLVGTPSNAQAFTCKQYLHSYWPTTTGVLLDFLDRLIRCTEELQGCKVAHDDMEISGSVTNGVLKLQTHGTKVKTIEIAQQLAFLAAALHHAPNDRLRISNSRVNLMMVHGKIPHFSIENTFIAADEKRSSCWTSLFTGSVVVDGFPIADRGEIIGLEIPLVIMAALIGAQRALEYEGGIVLKGHSSAFVPLKRQGDSIQWHYIRNDEDERLPYSAIETRCPGRAMLDEVEIESLKTTRAFVGWWGSTETHLGTISANYENIDFSDARQAERPLTFSGATLGFQQFGVGEASFNLGARDGKLHMQRKGPYQRIVQCISKSPVVLYDTCEKRAWLVPSSAVILHIARKRDHKNPYVEDNKHFRFPYVELRHSRDPHDAAEKVLLYSASVKLCMQDEFGCPNYYFRDLVLDIWSYLETLLDKNVTKDNSSVPELRGTTRDKLRGWEFMDLVDDNSPFLLKETYIEKTGGCWTDLARDINAIVLFGSGFEDVIKPKDDSPGQLCHAWKTVPKGRDYLTTTVPMLNLLYERAGSKLTRKHLTSTHLQWHQAGKLWDCCDSKRAFSCDCDRIQQIVSASTVGLVLDPGPLEENGAVIFGLSCNPVSSTIRKLLETTTKKESCLFSQPNQDFLITIPASSPDTNSSLDSGAASITSASTLLSSDEETEDLTKKHRSQSRSPSSPYVTGIQNAARGTCSLKRGYSGSITATQEPYRRRHNQFASRLDTTETHCRSETDATVWAATSEESMLPPSNKDLGAGKPHTLRRQVNFTKHTENISNTPMVLAIPTSRNG